MTKLFDHIPVLKDEMLDAMAPAAGETHVDATYGGGGYTQGLFDRAPGVKVIGLDRDPEAASRAARHTNNPDFTFIATNFGDMANALAAKGIDKVDAIVLDIGVSSFQIDDARRGFSFMADGPLDMRMDNAKGESAADIVNTREENELADILYVYGEERNSRRIARAIVAARPVTTTAQLAAIIEKAMPRGKEKQHPATRSFQALRIFVNDELGELERALDASKTLLKTGGRLVVVTFHSLEDRIVKKFMQDESGRAPNASRFAPVAAANQNAPLFDLPFTKTIGPSDAEVARNPRARSAKLRLAIRTEAAA